MKFALVNGDKTEAQPGLRGTCEHCQSDMITKCGQVKIWHWAHKSKFSCDPWWENETEWHRAWKKHFPEEFQEIGHFDSTNEERHVADIKTAGGFVIEFQHSAIDSDEIKSREAFYKNMVWVVDGTRLKSGRDYANFCKGFINMRSTIVEGYFRLILPAECFPKNWVRSSVPVYFDFQGIAPLDQSDEKRAALWCLLPGRADQSALVARISREQFRDLSSNDPRSLPTRDSFSAKEKSIQEVFAKEVEVTAALKKRKELQAAAHQQYLNSLILRRFRRRPL